MDVLYLAHRIPYPPTKGEKLRAFHAIRHLAARHRVWCACFVDRKSDLAHVPALAAHCHRLEAVPLNRIAALVRGGLGLLAGRTVTESYFGHVRMAETILHWARDTAFDAVIAFSSGMGQYVPLARAKRRIVDFCDLDSRKWLDYAANARGLPRVLYQAEGRRLERVERHWIEHSDASVFVTEAEAGPLLSSPWREKLHVVGNGVDAADVATAGNVSLTEGATDGCAAGGASLTAGAGAGAGEVEASLTAGVADRAVAKGASPAPRIGFVGDMSYWPNVDAVRWFLRHCWPNVRREHPNAAFEIVGRHPARAVLKLARTPGVEVTGEVRDARAHVRRWSVSVAPLRIARGLQNKVLEAMALARPVVLTTAAATGIDAVDGRDWLIADDADAFAGSVAALLADPGRAARVGSAAREYVLKNHQWPIEMAKLEVLVTSSPGPLRLPRSDMTARKDAPEASRGF